MALVTEATRVARSADYSTAAIVLGDDSGGPVYLYSFTNGEAGASASLNAFVTFPGLSGDGGVLAVNGGDTEVLNLSTASVLGTVFGSGGMGVAISSDGTTGYSLTSTAVDVLNVPRFLVSSSIPLPSGTTGTGQLFLSADDNTLVGIVSSGAVIITDLAAPPAETPEVGEAIFLPLLAGGMLIAGAFIQRRRRLAATS